MPDKKIKCEVVHPKLYLSVEGKLQHIKPGTEVELSEKQVESMGKKVVTLADKKKRLEQAESDSKSSSKK